MKYRAIVLEGKTDEAFILEVLKQRHNGVQCKKDTESPGFNCRTIVELEDIKDYKIATVISDGESELVRFASLLIRGSIDGITPDLERIAICRDLNRLKREGVIGSIISQFQSRFGSSVIPKSFGCEISGFNVYIIPVGNPDLTHQCKEWGHCVEDYLIEVMQNSINEITCRAYNKVCVDAIIKGISLDLNTSAKSPLYLTMAFTQPKGNLEGFYRKLVGENFQKIDEILRRTSFTERLEEFLS